jgi:hypothetical protein
MGYAARVVSGMRPFPLRTKLREIKTRRSRGRFAASKCTMEIRLIETDANTTVSVTMQQEILTA